METLKLSPDEKETARLRQIVDNASSFQHAVKRVMDERKVSEGLARLLVAKAGPNGATLYNQFRAAGN